MEMVNGYVFLDLTKANVYSKALKVLGTDKPVVIKDGSGSPYFVDSLTLDGTNVVITKGGKTITIANDNTITNVGDIQNHLYQITDFECNDDDTDGNTIFDDSTYDGYVSINIYSSIPLENTINSKDLLQLALDKKVYIGFIGQMQQNDSEIFLNSSIVNTNLLSILTSKDTNPSWNSDFDDNFTLKMIY